MSAASAYQLTQGVLRHQGRDLIAGVDQRLSLEEPLGCGTILRFVGDARATHRVKVGRIPHLTASTCLHRTSPYWMVPRAGGPGAEVPLECQWFLARLADGSCLLLAPLVAGRRRWTLETENGQIALNGSANDPTVVEHEGSALFIAHGQDPYELMPRAAAALAARMGWKTRAERLQPHTGMGLGWCTFNAYYADISHDKIRTALTSLAAAGIPLRWLLIDGGWQAGVRGASQEEWMRAIPADLAKFPNGLGETIRMAKEEFRLPAVMVWHALLGLPAGMTDSAVPGLPVTLKNRHHPPAIYAAVPTIDEWFGPRVSAPAARDAGRFFRALHQHLKEQGADSVKVDFQSTLESICQGEGGRVAYDRAWREALEESCLEHFAGGLINCMSCSSECLYLGRGSALVRTSDDYYPNRPDAHGLHLHTNAQMGMWFGEFVQPDWDMFQSGHPYGGYHAAGRALSGGPLLITDEVGKHDAAVVRRLVLPDGQGLPVASPGRPCPDTLYRDPTRERCALKVFTRAPCTGAGMVGLFHANHGERLAIDTDLGASDVPGLENEEVIALLHHAGRAVRLAPGQRTSLSLAHAGHEVATLAPVRDGLAVIGLADRYCAPSAVSQLEDKSGVMRCQSQGGGPFSAWSERAPKRVEVDGQAVEWHFDAASGLGSCAVPPGSHAITIHR